MFVSTYSRRALVVTAAVLAPAASTHAASTSGDVQRGARVAQACMACHPLTLGQHMAGLILAGIWGRNPGSAEGVRRHSDALRRSGLVWTHREHGAWLANPTALVSGNTTGVPGIAA